MINYEFTNYFTESDFEKMTDSEFAVLDYLEQRAESADIAVYNALLGDMDPADASEIVDNFINDLTKRKEVDNNWIVEKVLRRALDAKTRLNTYLKEGD